MDREALARRNRSMAEAFHAVPLKHHLRRLLLWVVATIPLPALRARRTNRILLIRPDHLGDLLLSTPAIHALRAARPDLEIHMLVGPWFADVMAAYPQVDRVLTLPFPGFSRSALKESMRSPYELVARSARQLRRIGYDSAVILRPDHWWGALLTHLAGIPQRIGYNLADVAPFLTQALPYRRSHAVIQNLRLIEHWTGEIRPNKVTYTFPLSEQDHAYVDQYLEAWGLSKGQKLICIHPGSGTWVKRWQKEKWATVADTLVDQLDASVVFTGGDHELGLVQSIAARMKHPAYLMAGDTRITQLAALFARALVVIGPDSGPLHLAAAVGTPTVGLFGPADPAEFSPWGPREKHIVLTSDIACRPCRVLDWGGDAPENHPCVRDITLGQVLEAARLAASAGQRGQNSLNRG